MAADQQQRVDGWREPAGRNEHSTAVVDNQLYLWGGFQRGMPEVHDSAEKRQFFSSVEVFDVNTGCWEQRTTRGTPPLGVYGYSCVAVRNELHYFGGYCGHSSDCHHNSVHTLSTSTLQWRMLAPSTTEGGAPMQKYRCGMVHFTDGEEDLLYMVGGCGYPAPSSPQHGAQYLQDEYDSGMSTNEQHIFSLSTNGWSSPVVTGQAPPPCSSFTLTTVGEKRAAMFGGFIQSSYSDDLYIIDLKRHSVNWSKINKPVIKSVQWPERRHNHAASHITGTVFVMIGGLSGSILSDVWLYDTNQWNKLRTLPHSVTKRYHPSVTERYRPSVTEQYRPSVTKRWYHSVSVFHLGAPLPEIPGH